MEMALRYDNSALAFDDATLLDPADESSSTFSDVPGKVVNLLRRDNRAIEAFQITKTTPLEDGQEWLGSFFERLHKLSNLSPNWDSYGAEPPNSTATKSSMEVLINLAALDVKPSKLSPSAEGGICISFFTNSHYADIECYNTGTILGVTSLNGEDTFVWEISKSDQSLNASIRKIEAFIN